MKIGNIKEETKNLVVRITANIIWEDNRLPEQEIFYETPVCYSDSFHKNSNIFLTACIMPALFAHEKRVKVEGEVCQVLCDGLRINIDLLRKWYGKKYGPVIIEADSMMTQPRYHKKGNVGLFLSGGIDSLFSLRQNRLYYPLDHEESIRDCYLVHGFDIDIDGQNNSMKVFERAVERAQIIADDVSVNLIPVYTNIRHLNNNVDFWMYWFHGAALASVAHCFSGRARKVLIASSCTVENLHPWGSHPILDANYSSLDVGLAHDQIFSRFEKTKILSNWKIALDNMRVGVGNTDDLLNCCQCNKCIRTMLHLLALEKLEESAAFHVKNVTASDLKTLKYSKLEDFKVHYSCVLDKLKEINRHDLVGIIKEELIWKIRLRQFYEQYFKWGFGKLRGAYFKLLKSVGLYEKFIK